MDEKEFELYNVTGETMAIMSIRDDTNKVITYLLEEDSDCIIYEPPLKIIKNACKYFGSSLEGRLEGTKEISNFTHKAPIGIDPSSGIYFFPTASPTKSDCSWISHSHIEKLEELEHNCTEIVFCTGQRIKVDVSIGIMRNQKYRTAQFRFTYNNRMREMVRKYKNEKYYDSW